MEVCEGIMEVSEGIDVRKTSASKECIICYNYWLIFLDKGCLGFNQLFVVVVMIYLWCLLTLTVLLFLNIHSVYYFCIIVKTTKSGAINLLRNADLVEKTWLIIKYKFSLSCMKDEQRNVNVWWYWNWEA